MKVKDLKAAPYNPRKIGDKELAMLGDSMEEFGDLSGIVFNVRTKRLIGGHQRIKKLKPSWEIKRSEHHDEAGTVAIGYIETPRGRWQYREVDWNQQKEIAANIAANKHGGIFDIPLLKDAITEIDDGAINLDLAGFQEWELEGLFGETVEPEPPETTSDGERPGRDVHCPKCGCEFQV